MRIDIACGGTGGHTFPGVATAQVLRGQGHAVRLWLAGRGVEELSARGWDGPVQSIRAAGLTGSGVARLRAVAGLGAAVVPSVRQLRCDRPAVLLAMGSYACVAPALAARLCGIPLILHEANAVPGAAVRLLSRLARETATGFAETARHLPGRRCHVTGFPVREAFRGLEHRAHDRFTLLVAGGSQGAHALNTCIPPALALLAARGLALRVIHLAGRPDAGSVAAAYRQAGVEHTVHAFLPEIWEAYAEADFAITRAGAATCAELAMARLPALLVPYPYAAGDHQSANARAMAATGAVDVRAQNEVSSDWLAEYLEPILRAPEGLAARRQALAALAAPDAAEQLAERVLRVGGYQHADL